MLKGKTAVVTGGTRGIGFAIAKKFLDNGANVAICGSRQDSVDKALAKLTEYEGRVMGIWPNLCDPQEVAEAFASVKARFGSLDILANNAGVSSRTSLYEYTVEEFTKIMDVNVKAVFVCSQAAARSSAPAPWSASTASPPVAAIRQASSPSTALPAPSPASWRRIRSASMRLPRA